MFCSTRPRSNRIVRQLRSRNLLLAVVSVAVSLAAVVAVHVPQSAAQAAPVVISEIYYNAPGADEGAEFVEILNVAADAVDLGSYTISGGIDYTFAESTMLAAGSAVVLAAVAEDFEAAFGFAPDGEYSRGLSNSTDLILLSNAAGITQDRVQYQDQAPWPLSADGDGDSLQLVDVAVDNALGGSWLAGPPTPNAPNQPNSAVLFTPQRGFFDGSVSVTLTSSVAGASIEYALDGGGWTTYTQPISITDNGRVRGVSARVAQQGATSEVQTHSYVFSPDEGAPVVVKWPNGMAAADGDLWTGSFEFITPPSVPLPSVGANAGWRDNRAGINSGASEKVYFRKEYGVGSLQADLFSDVYFGPVAPEAEIDQLALRNSQGDATHVKQVVSHDALASLGLLSPHSRFVKLYEDGRLSGIRQMQERPEGGFMEAYTGHDKPLWDSTNWTTDGLLGDVNAAAELPTLDEFKRITNLDHFIGYSLVDFLAADGDGWWKKNWRLTGPADASIANGDDLAWHFFLWDEDDAWGSSSWEPSQTGRWSRQPYEGPEFLFHDLMDILEFRYLWADAAECAYRNDGPLTHDRHYPRVVERVEQLAALGKANDAFLRTMSTWVDARTDFLFSEFVSDGLYPQVAPVQVEPAGGELAANSVVTVDAPAGREIWYSVDGTDPRRPDGSRSDTAIQALDTIPLGSGDHELLVRSFDPAEPDVFQRWSAACPVTFTRPMQPGSVTINEVHYNPASEGVDGEADYVSGSLFEFVELHNAGATEVGLSGWAFSDGVELVFPTGTTIAAGGYLTIASDSARFAQRYGSVPDAQYAGRLSDTGETIALADRQGAVIDAVPFDDKAPWPVAADGEGPSLARINPALASDDPTSWGSSRDAHGDPGSANRTGLLGDIDRDDSVDAADVSALLEALAGASVAESSVADIDGDGRVDLRDALLLARQLDRGDA